MGVWGRSLITVICNYENQANHIQIKIGIIIWVFN